MTLKGWRVVKPQHNQTLEFWFGIAFGKISSIFDVVIYPPHVRIITWVNINEFSPNLICALIFRTSGVGLQRGRFCQFLTVIYMYLPHGPGGSVGCAVRLETRRSWVQPPPRSATFFRGDWSWNIFYGHSLPSADTRRAVVSFWWKNVHNTG